MSKRTSFKVIIPPGDGFHGCGLNFSDLCEEAKGVGSVVGVVGVALGFGADVGTAPDVGVDVGAAPDLGVAGVAAGVPGRGVLAGAVVVELGTEVGAPKRDVPGGVVLGVELGATPDLIGRDVAGVVADVVGVADVASGFVEVAV